MIAHVLLVEEVKKLFRFFERPQKGRRQQVVGDVVERGEGLFGDIQALGTALVSDPGSAQAF